MPGIYGLYATIVPLLAYALFGPSRILVLGPDSALVAIILAVVLPLSAGDPARAIILASAMALVSGLVCICLLYTSRRQALSDDSPRAHLKAMIDGNFDDSQVSGPAMKTWLAFWASSMHQPALRRLQRVNDHRLYSNLCGQFHRVLPQDQARFAARGLASLIDGLWLRGALSGEAFDTCLLYTSFILIVMTGFWEQTVVTLGLTFSSTLISLLLGIPLGIWAARSERVATIIRPILDLSLIHICWR